MGLPELYPYPPELQQGQQLEVLRYELTVLQLQPGDVLVLRCPCRLSMAQALELKRMLQDAVPGRKVLVLEEGLDLGVLRAEPAAPLRADLSEPAVEAYIQALPWSPETTDQERTLVAGNLRAFAAAAREVGPTQS